MEIQGKLIHVGDTQQVSEKFQKRDFVIEHSDNPMYPQESVFQLAQDRTSMLDNIPVGSQVKVVFNLRGRSWEKPGQPKRWFNTLDAWKIDVVDEVVAAGANGSQASSVDDDVPF